MMCTCAFVLLGCSHTLHYNYPPPHPPSRVLDLSSIQEPEAPPEQSPPENTPSQKQETPQELKPIDPQTERPVLDDPGPDATEQQEIAGARGPDNGFPYELKPRVKYWIERLSGREKKTFQSQLARLDKIRPTIEEILVQHGLPADLSYLCLVESGANAHAVSCSGATGYWQFIPYTARRYGLQMNKYVDERKNLEKSTQAAALYLKHLYTIFGDWHLAIAAYNAGEGTVMRLMKSEGINTFWEIDYSMPIKTETIEYVPKFIATLVIASDREAYGLPPSRSSSPGVPRTIDTGGYLKDIARTDRSAKNSLAQTRPEIVTDANSASLAEIRRNIRRNAEGAPGIDDEGGASSISYTIRKGDTLYSIARKYSTTIKAISRANNMQENKRLKVGKTIVIPATGSGRKTMGDELQPRVHMVAKGETIRSISRKYGVTVEEIIQANKIRNPRSIQPKTALVIPPSHGRTDTVSTTKYTVKKGDTLWAISRQFDVSSTDLMKWNRITSTAQIKPGDELTIYQQ